MNTNTEDHKFMQLALEQARAAFDKAEVPIGAIIVTQSGEVFSSHNLVENSNCATAHAEIKVIELASKFLNRWRLDDCCLYVTLEPCPMCMGAIRLARIKRLVIAATESRMGCVSKFKSLMEASELGPVPELVTGILQDEAENLLKEFFKIQRIRNL